MQRRKIRNRRTDTGRYYRDRKEARRRGEHRAGREEIGELLVMSRSGDPEERFVAADNLCPCHVRTRIEEVQEALYRLMEDPDAKVRRAAWHTLLDGGYPKEDARRDFDNPLAFGGEARPALLCEACDRQPQDR